MFADDRETDTEAETGAATGALGGVERIEKALDRIGRDADAVVLESNGSTRADTRQAYLDAAGFADFADGLLGVGGQIQEDLDELIGIGDDAREIGLRTEIDLDVISTEGVFVELEGAAGR